AHENRSLRRPCDRTAVSVCAIAWSGPSPAAHGFQSRVSAITLACRELAGSRDLWYGSADLLRALSVSGRLDIDHGWWPGFDLRPRRIRRRVSPEREAGRLGTAGTPVGSGDT